MPVYLQLNARELHPRRKDDLTEALTTAALNLKEGDHRPMVGYYLNYVPPGLREVTLGQHSRLWVNVSRMYPTLDPVVVVDFEPAPPDPWWHDEKAKFFTEQNILYLPIALTDRLTLDQFTSRYKEAKRLLDRSRHDMLEDQALADGTIPPRSGFSAGDSVEEWFLTPEVVQAFNNRALALADAMRDSRGYVYGGAIRLRHIRNHKADLVRYYRDEMRHGMDREQCYRELTDPTARRADGQIHTPVTSGAGAERH